MIPSKIRRQECTSEIRRQPCPLCGDTPIVSAKEKDYLYLKIEEEPTRTAYTVR